MEAPKKVVLEGTARIGKVTLPAISLTLSPEDVSSPLSFQMALNELIEKLMKSLEEGPKSRYMAEVRLRDALGTPVVFAVDLGDKLPPFSKDKVKARIIIEFYDDEDTPPEVEP